MENSLNAKYKKGDNFYHIKYPNLIREVLWIYKDEYIERNEIQYMMSSNQKGYSPSPMLESAIDNYYKKN
jgi:hypothetical protein